MDSNRVTLRHAMVSNIIYYPLTMPGMHTSDPPDMLRYDPRGFECPPDSQRGSENRCGLHFLFSMASLICRLVGGIPTPLKNMKVNWDIIIPNI